MLGQDAVFLSYDLDEAGKCKETKFYIENNERSCESN